jgi:tRNA (guanine37-N1)-methyltransferase
MAAAAAEASSAEAVSPSSASASSTASSTSAPSSFDFSRFDDVDTLSALRVPRQEMAAATAFVRKHHLLYTASKVRTILDDPSDSTCKLLVLRERFAVDPSADSAADVAAAKALPAELAAYLAENPNIQLVPYSLRISASSLTLTTLLRRALPASVISAAGGAIPSAFETVGHIAHLNLLDAYLPYRHLIGAAILFKFPALRTVVTKLGAISSEFRVFPMEVIAGVADTCATLREHGCTFQFDFAKVYWNSRLQTEHARLVDLFVPNSSIGSGGDAAPVAVADLFCGVGPFALPAAKLKR